MPSDTRKLTQGASVTDVFSYTVTDEHGATSTANLTITITGTNDAPLAVADTNATDPVTEAGVQDGGNTPELFFAIAAATVLSTLSLHDALPIFTVAAVNGVSGNVGAAVVGTYG